MNDLLESDIAIDVNGTAVMKEQSSQSLEREKIKHMNSTMLLK